MGIRDIKPEFMIYCGDNLESCHKMAGFFIDKLR